MGDPASADTTTGALVSKDHLSKVHYYIDLARQEGATIQCGHSVDELPDGLGDVSVDWLTDWEIGIPVYLL